MTDAIGFLEAAADVMRERGRTYDKASGERSIAATVAAFNAITGHALTEADGWGFMLLLKLVRQYQAAEYHPDSALDAVAYSALMAEALANEP